MDEKDEVLREIRALRKDLRVSQAQMAIELNICESAYRKIESGKSPLSISRFFKIREVLGLGPGVSTNYEVVATEKIRLEHAMNELRAEIWFLREQNMSLMKALRLKEAEAYFPMSQSARDRERGKPN